MKTIIILSALAIILEVTNSYSLRTTIINRKPLCRSLNSVDSKDIGGIEGGLTPQIARLKAMAAKLRAEAADMEAVQKVEDLKGITSVFSKFDLDNDGSISIEELRQGLEEALMVTVTQQQVRKVMAQFDKSGKYEFNVIISSLLYSKYYFVSFVIHRRWCPSIGRVSIARC